MFSFIQKSWQRLILNERPSLSLGLFRIAVAFTTWSAVFPSLVHYKQNYFPEAFKTFNYTFFPKDFVLLVQESPEWMITAFVVLFCVSSFTMFIGLLSQISCILMTACCYYFYALNSYHVSTLSWDILLVNLFLMCVTSYPGDYFSVDALFKRDELAYKRLRPYFLQRMLQFQIAFMFFYTALYKTTAQGNWINDNPLFYVFNYPPDGVTKTFLLKDYLVGMPQLVYGLGLGIVAVEFLMIILLFNRKTRVMAIYCGVIFHILLMLTLDVPATFFFLFPAQLMLFINPKKIVKWIERRRQRNQSYPHGVLLFDGNCGFCRFSLSVLKVMDMFSAIKYVDANTISDLTVYHADLTKKKCDKAMQLVDETGRLSEGFYAFRTMCVWMPMAWGLLLIFYLPFAGFIGNQTYRLIAANRSLFSRFISCQISS